MVSNRIKNLSFLNSNKEIIIFTRCSNQLAYQLVVDFGAIGIKKSSAQITDLYTKEELLHKQVSAVVNFKPRQIANFMSECLILGVYNNDGNVVLLQTSQPIKNGEQIR